MNADLKQQIEDVLAEWRNSDDDLFSFEETCDRMAAMLQELIDAPEAEPVAYVTGYNNGYPTIAPINSALCMAIGTALYFAPPAPSVPDVLPATNPSQISSFTEPVEWLPGGFRIEHFTKDDPMLTDEANAERRFFVTRIESPYHKDGVWFGATAEDALAKACAAIGVDYANAPPAPSVPDGLHLLISGAVYDFAGFLTTREKTIQVGARVGADIVVDLLKEWAALRGLKLDDAAVLSWQEWLSPTQPEPPADVARDAARWQMLPAFLAEFQVPYLQLVDKIDAAIERQGGE